MKRFILLLVILFLGEFFLSQAQFKFTPKYDSSGKIVKANFNEFKLQFDNYLKNKLLKNSGQNDESDIEENGDYKIQRMLYFAQNRLLNGNTPSGNFINNELEKFLKAQKGQINIQAPNQWTLLGPINQPLPWQPNYKAPALMGRINTVAFDPKDDNIIWIGSAGGGVWKSTNGGKIWQAMDFSAFQTISISDIQIDKNDGNIVYVSTGDPDWFPNDVFYSGYSIGVVKTTDGGISWKRTSLFQSDNIDGYQLVTKMAIDPTNSKNIYAGTNNGLYFSNDAGNNWSKLGSESGYFRDIILNPGNPNILYAACDDYSGTYKINSYDTQSKKKLTTSGFNGVNRIALAVSANAPNSCYALLSDYSSNFIAIQKTLNNGKTWNSITGNKYNYLARNYKGEIIDGDYGQGGYDLALAVLPTDSNLITIGGINVWEGDDGGVSFINIGQWDASGNIEQVHADHHCLRYNNKGVLYDCNDGGLYYSTPDLTWVNVTNNLSITQFYKMSSNNNGIVIGGSQDNGTSIMSNNTWKTLWPGDGMACWINPIFGDKNSTTLIVSNPSGAFQRSSDMGTTWSNNYIISPFSTGENGDWVTPIAVDPNNSNLVYVGYNNVWKSTNNGLEFQKMGNLNNNSAIRSIAVSPINSNIIYATNLNQLFRTVDGGDKWTTIYTSNSPISGIAPSYTNSDEVWITMGGFDANMKIIKILPDTVINFSKGLPNVPMICLALQRDKNKTVYIGSDLGVFYMDNISNSWNFYGKGLPNVIVTDMQILETIGKLRVSTYGRGIWEIPLSKGSTGVANETPNEHQIEKLTLIPNPNSSNNLILDVNPKYSTIKVEIYSIIGNKIYESVINSQNGSFQLNHIDLNSGIYNIRIIDINGELVGSDKLIISK